MQVITVNYSHTVVVQKFMLFRLHITRFKSVCLQAFNHCGVDRHYLNKTMGFEWLLAALMKELGPAIPYAENQCPIQVERGMNCHLVIDLGTTVFCLHRKLYDPAQSQSFLRTTVTRDLQTMPARVREGYYPFVDPAVKDRFFDDMLAAPYYIAAVLIARSNGPIADFSQGVGFEKVHTHYVFDGKEPDGALDNRTHLHAARALDQASQGGRESRVALTLAIADAMGHLPPLSGPRYSHTVDDGGEYLTTVRPVSCADLSVTDSDPLVQTPYTVPGSDALTLLTLRWPHDNRSNRMERPFVDMCSCPTTQDRSPDQAHVRYYDMQPCAVNAYTLLRGMEDLWNEFAKLLGPGYDEYEQAYATLCYVRRRSLRDFVGILAPKSIDVLLKHIYALKITSFARLQADDSHLGLFVDLVVREYIKFDRYRMMDYGAGDLHTRVRTSRTDPERAEADPRVEFRIWTLEQEDPTAYKLLLSTDGDIRTVHAFNCRGWTEGYTHVLSGTRRCQTGSWDLYGERPVRYFNESAIYARFRRMIVKALFIGARNSVRRPFHQRYRIVCPIAGIKTATS
jgi:hypothetical protein